MSSEPTTTRKAGRTRLPALAGVLALLMSAAGASRSAASPGGMAQSDLVARNLYWLVSPNPDNRVRAAEYLMRRGNQDAVPAMIDAYIYREFQTEQLSEALRELSRQDFGGDYHDWFEWMVRAGIKGPPIYRKWKADLYSRIDPRFGTFLDASRPHTIAYEEIQWGGVVAEGIPSLDSPTVVSAGEAEYLADNDLAFGAVIETDGDTPQARAYPLRILDWHEMTNDVIGGVPVALSYCTLCGSGILFDRRVGERQFTFATSGLLYRSNKLMFDRDTESLWSNLTGKPVIGPLVEEAIELDVLPLVVTTWEAWRREHPDTTVLSLDTGYERDYRPGQPYGAYFSSPNTMFPVGPRDDRLPAKAWVFGMRIDDHAVAFELEALREFGVLNTAVGSEQVVLVMGEARAVRAYARGDRIFSASEARLNFIIADDGSLWRATDLGLIEEAGPGRLRRLPGHLAYWFGWYAFFPDTNLWQGE